MYPRRQSLSHEEIKSLLTLPNIQYIVQGLDVLLQNNLDGDNRIRAIELRDELYRILPVFSVIIDSSLIY